MRPHLGLTVLATLLLSSAAVAAKPAVTCRPTLPAPTGLIVESDGTTISSTWNEVESVANEATKYSVEITAHYDALGDVKFVFTASDGDPGVLDTASFAIAASGLDTTVCDDLACATSTTHQASSVTVQVKGLLPPKKGRDSSQCNPFSEPFSLSVACPCGDAAFVLKIATNSAAGIPEQCVANYFDGFRSLWRVAKSSNPVISLDALDVSGVLACRHFDHLGVQFSQGNLSPAQFSACTTLIEAAQLEFGCASCLGDNCPTPPPP